MFIDAKAFSVKSQTGFTTIALACIFALYLPIITLVVFAFNDTESMSVWGGFSLRWFRSAWYNQTIQDAAFRSLQVAAIAATLATAMGALAAIATTRTAPYRGLNLKYALINQPMRCFCRSTHVNAHKIIVVYAFIGIATNQHDVERFEGIINRCQFLLQVFGFEHITIGFVRKIQDNTVVEKPIQWHFVNRP